MLMAELSQWLRATLSGVESRDGATSTLRNPAWWLTEALGAETGSVSVAAALAHADVYACVRVLADSVASLPLIVYRRSGDGRNRETSSTAARLLRRPSPSLSQFDLLGTLMMHLCTWGNGYIAKYRNPGGAIVQLGLLNPQRVSVKIEAGEPVFSVIDGHGAQRTYSRRDVIHVKAMSADGVIGMSPIGQARAAIGVGMALEEYAEQFMQNNTAPSGVITVKGEMSDPAIARLAKQWKRMRGPKHAGSTIVLEEDAQWKPVSMPSRDAQFVEQRKLSSTQIARIFRIPPYMIGAESGNSMTYANVEQESLHFLQHSLRPWLVCIEQAVGSDEDLFSIRGNQYPEFLVDAMLRADTKTRYEAYQIATANQAFMTRDEIRARENLPATSGGDTFDKTQPQGG